MAAAEQAARQKLSELQRTMENERSQGVVLKAILQAKESGAIPGIYGRLGDLGAIDGNLCPSPDVLRVCWCSFSS